MSIRLRLDCWMVSGILCLVLVASGVLHAQDLSSKLSQTADFIPTTGLPKDQLIELARHYKLPMGIEWIYLPDQLPRKLSINTQQTVAKIINTIIQQTPGYTLEIKNGVINISNNSFAASPHNFLNLRIPEYRASNLNVFGAESLLRMTIASTLHPERYVGGRNGGYGYGIPREDGFDIRNISFSGKNLTVRDVLNALVKENGNSLWVVELNPSKMMKEEPFFAQRSYGNDVQTYFAWQIVPLASTGPVK
jgi:hypothetical protein